MMDPTTHKRADFTLTHAGSDTQTTDWIRVDGYTKATVSGSWTGDLTSAVTIEATDEPAAWVVGGGAPQPAPTAVQIDTVVTLTNVAPAAAASTVGARDEYDNLLPIWVRLKSIASTAESGVLDMTLVLKATS